MDRATNAGSDRARGAWELLVEFELRRGRMRGSLTESLRTAIQNGRLPAATALPASRRLAADLGVSRGVVTDAYDRLVSEGYLEVQPRSAPVVRGVVVAPPSIPEPSEKSFHFDFHPTSPDVGLFPRRAWLRAVDRALSTAPDRALDYGDHRGRIELRTALSTYLARVRGVRIDPGRIVVTQGFSQAFDVLCRVLVERGASRVAMETPSHSELWSTVRKIGLRLVGCRVDADGLRVSDLSRLRADAVVVSPAHQFPTGAVMSPARRQAIVDWATKHEGLLIEDDYDAEFRYDRTPVGAVQGLAPGRVVHVGSASKTLAPALRIGWMSLPADLVGDVALAKSLADGGSPAIDQLAFADLLSSGEYERYVVRARQAYRRRRDLLVGALVRKLPTLEFRGAAAGMQLLLRIPDHADDVEIAHAAASRGIAVGALSPLHLAPSSDRGLLLGYGRLPENRVERAVDALSAVIIEAGATRPGAR